MTLISCTLLWFFSVRISCHKVHLLWVTRTLTHARWILCFPRWILGGGKDPTRTTTWPPDNGPMTDHNHTWVYITCTILVVLLRYKQNVLILQFFLLKERYDERQREPRLTLRPPSLAAPYTPVQNWHHQPEKLIFESCGYEANVIFYLL